MFADATITTWMACVMVIMLVLVVVGLIGYNRKRKEGDKDKSE